MTIAPTIVATHAKLLVDHATTAGGKTSSHLDIPICSVMIAPTSVATLGTPLVDHATTAGGRRGAARPRRPPAALIEWGRGAARPRLHRSTCVKILAMSPVALESTRLLPKQRTLEEIVMIENQEELAVVT